MAFVRQFQPTIEIPLEAGRKLLCFHGSPHSFDNIILPDTPDDTVRQFLGGFAATLLTGGHTHTQQLRRLGNSWYVNPGSVSLAYNWELSDPTKGQMRVDPWADYAIVSSEGACLGITFRHVPFDVDELAHIIRTSGFQRSRAPRTSFMLDQTANDLSCAWNTRRADQRQSPTAGRKRPVTTPPAHLPSPK